MPALENKRPLAWHARLVQAIVWGSVAVAVCAVALAMAVAAVVGLWWVWRWAGAMLLG